MAEEIKKFVEDECRSKSSKYYDEWICHFNFVSSNALRLADKLNADREVVFLASWLHDIGSVIHGKENHHIIGAEIAEKKLRELGYPESKMGKIKHCILAHRGSQNIPRETIEAQIVADADATAHFENVKDLIRAEFVLGGVTDMEQANQNVKQKLVGSWNKLSPPAKEFIKEKYEAAMLLLN